MKRFALSLVAVFTLCAQALAADSAPTVPADLETAWQKADVAQCQPTPEKNIAMVSYTQPADGGLMNVRLITTLNGERVSVVEAVLMGPFVVEVKMYVRKGSGWTFYDHQTQESTEASIQHERNELGVTEEQYKKCFD